MGKGMKFFDTPAAQSRIKSDDVKIVEMGLGYLIAPLCAMLANSIFGAYLNRYYVDVLGWTKFGAFATLLPIVSVIFVVAGNLLVGQWIDSTMTKAGKARPYLLISVPIMAVGLLLMFCVPTGAPNALQMLWIAVSYNIFCAIGYPCYYTAHSSMVSLSTRNPEQRGLLATLSNAGMVAAAGIGASILVPVLLQSYMFVTGEDGVIDTAASYHHWQILSVVFCVLTAGGVLCEFFFTRERITEESLKLGITEKKRSMKEHMAVCMGSKYWWMVMLFLLVFQLGQLLKNSSMSFYVRWMFDSVISSPNPESASGALMSTLGLIGGLPSAVGMLVAWPIANKFGKKRAIIVGLIFSVAGGLIGFINGNSFPIVCTAVILKGIGIIPAQYVMLAVVSDVLDHLEAQHGFRSDGFTMSIYSAVMVGLAGLAIGIINALLTASGYSASLTDQMPATKGVLALVYLGMDVISFVLGILLLAGMNVEKYAEEDRAAIKQHQKEAVLAEGGEWKED